MLTDVQDPTDRYAPFLEEVRRDGEARAPRYGIARLVHLLFLELVMHVLMLMVRMAKRAQDRTLPEVASVAGEEASPPVVDVPAVGAPAGYVPAVGMPASSHVRPGRERCEQPEMMKPIAEAPCEMPVVAQPAGLPRRARVRKSKDQCGLAPAPPLHVDNGYWPLRPGQGIGWTTEVGFGGSCSRKWVLESGDKCVHLVSI